MLRVLTIIGALTLLVAVIAAAGWFIVFTVKRAEDPAQVTKKWIVTVLLAILSVFSVVLFGVLGPLIFAVLVAMVWTPQLGASLVAPLTSIFDGGSLEPEARPAYSTAQARQKQGRYAEAVAEIGKQLERFPTDFEGQMLMARIMAEDLKDLPGADFTIQQICAQGAHAPRNIAYALNTLADWQLKYKSDREAARQALQRVPELLPETEFALIAAQRIAHLEHPERAEAKTFHVTEGPKNLGITGVRAVSAPQPDPEQLAQLYVRHLEQHPLDTEVREKLALIYLEHYGRLDMATAELEQLIQEPHQPPRSVIRWLNILADCQVRSGAPYETVKATLQRIIELQPNFATAETARRRIELLKLELKAKEKSPDVKLGSYEQNIGLKGRLPHQF